MPHITSRSWTDQDIARLQQMAAEGASILRAAAALKRNTSSVAKLARRHGIKLVGTRQLKAQIRELDKKALFGRF
ncbi:hypothetical protein [Tardiphaga sp.]|jgi:GcrA cell cycle regulator|uniref:hypothetical protein n=1 Tax=Tardiphaga sp. TaxID=1926292 RepID=UPI0037DA1D43